MGKFKRTKLPFLVENYLNKFLKTETLEQRYNRFLYEVAAPEPTLFGDPEASDSGPAKTGGQGTQQPGTQPNPWTVAPKGPPQNPGLPPQPAGPGNPAWEEWKKREEVFQGYQRFLRDLCGNATPCPPAGVIIHYWPSPAPGTPGSGWPAEPPPGTPGGTIFYIGPNGRPTVWSPGGNQTDYWGNQGRPVLPNWYPWKKKVQPIFNEPPTWHVP
jgi:hypothetical protein